MTTVAEALRAAAQRLSETCDTARLDAELLMAYVLGVTRSDVLLRHGGDPVPDGFDTLVERRAAHEPVAYLLGEQEFYGLPFAVTRDVLIPRADSETTLMAALDAAPKPARVLDCGTGSGALLLAFLAERPEAEGIGVDASPGALGVAAANAESLGLTGRAQFVRRDWHEPDWAAGLGRFDCILANPPYVEADASLAPDVRDYEPAAALFAGADGLSDYRALIPQLPQLMSENGIAAVEIGASQADPVRQIAEQSGFSAVLHKDLAGRPRALLLRFPLGKGRD